VSKPEWGAKHTCQSCGAKFYDLLRSPIVCPRCDTEVNADTPQRNRRARPTPAKAAAATAAVEAASPDELDDLDETEDQEDLEDVEDIDLETDDETAVEEVDTADEGLDDDPADGDGSDLIEDASELGEDDDMPGLVAGEDETES
jgi:uncharacterized protein (TIGR02300 family)